MLVLLMCIFSFACLVISILTLLIVLRSSLVSGGDREKSTSNEELVLISGCDSGIGLELAKYIHQNTQYTILCGFLQMSTSDGYKELARVISRDRSSRLILKKLDITRDEDIDNIKKTIEELKSSGKIRNLVALINNAGTMRYGEFDWLTWNQIQCQIEVNLIGTIRLTRSLIPYIIQSKGRIINISSVNDKTVFPGLSVYSATKSALSAFSRGLGYELRKFDAHVITFRLGDFARLTNIMSSHEKNRDDMWNAMDSKKRSLYGDFFHEFNDHLLKNFGMTSPKRFRDSTLFSDFKRVLLIQSPPNSVTCAPITFKVFYFIIELLPISLQYQLLDLLLQFGFKWNPSQVDDSSTTMTAATTDTNDSNLKQLKSTEVKLTNSSTSHNGINKKKEHAN